MHLLIHSYFNTLIDRLNNFELIKNHSMEFTNLYSIFYGLLISFAIMQFLIIYFNKKHHFNSETNNRLKSNTNVIKLHLILVILSIISFLIILPVLLLIILVFIIYKKIIDSILKLKYKSQYGGILEGNDTMWAIEDISRSIINILFIVNYEGTPEEFYKLLKKCIYRKFYANPKKFPKLSSIRQKYFGYYYLLEGKHDLNSCISKLSCDYNIINKNDLQQIINDIGNKPLPINNCALWEIIVGNKSVQWKDQTASQYPIIFRIHHSVGDGMALLKMLAGYIADEIKCQTKQQLKKNAIKNPCKLNINPQNFFLKFDLYCGLLKTWKNFQVIWKKSKFYFKTFFTIGIAPAVMVLQILMKPKDTSILHGSKLSGEKILVWKVEEEKQFINTIKHIKNKFTKTKFSEVVLTAIFASFNEYFEKNSVDIPETITIILPVLSSNSTDIPGKYDNIPIVLHNRISVGMLNLPIHLDRNYSLLNRLKKVQFQVNLLRNSPDFQVNYWLLSVICYALPEYLLKPVLHSAHSTLVVSNLPGSNQLTIFDGNRIEDIVFWIPNRGTTGLGLSILSYDGRLQLGLIADKILISTEEKAQQILDNIKKYLNLLYDEVNLYV